MHQVRLQIKGSDVARYSYSIHMQISAVLQSWSKPKNYPLFIRSVPIQNELKFHYTVHTSLDVVEEKISAVGKAMADQRELYLGLLYPTEDYKVYGYVTNSKVKFVIVVDSSNTSLRDNEIRSMFRKLHNSFTDVMCNPFYNPGDTIQSKAFDSIVSAMMVQAS
ncbi:trafficking protein particle complex subunit 2-like protein isoform X3 [Oncorhynchus tshawytscha]|uniref:Trafficking protein particle complex subunit 2-like protein n=1 Tax=Oncorhynchus tshawytscha TaxID=74940 RepID=A0AAZ3PIY5_ONCTS|nr:trafficking protein particle complex subunit 2-like protein isoform X3 [Oncorhynchus tshawytscha]